MVYGSTETNLKHQEHKKINMNYDFYNFARHLQFRLSKVCQDYVNGVCSSSESECSAAHPSLELLRDKGRKRITVCMDFVKGRCTRESCRYFHPPSHLQGKLKTVKISQSQLSVVSIASFTRVKQAQAQGKTNDKTKKPNQASAQA